MVRMFLLFVLGHGFVTAAAQNRPVTDGPYVFYTSQAAVINTITNGQLQKDSITFSKAHATPLRVPVPKQPGTFFEVRLKQEVKPEPSTTATVANLFVLSDIEGTFDGLVKLLTTGGVINKNYGWQYGTGHLVICGDLFDRGDAVLPCLWLLYKLEDEARAAGGQVHVLLGNHDVMNLSQDYRYVNPVYGQSAAMMGKPYDQLYNADTELGRWLRSKNIVERIGDFLFMHAGISQPVNEAGLTLDDLNNRARPLYEWSGMDSIIAAAGMTPFFTDDAPYWYRGYFLAPRASMAQVDSTLQLYGVKHIVVGHTIVDSIQTTYDGKVIAIDVNYHAANYEALVIEHNRFFRMTADGTKTELH